MATIKEAPNIGAVINNSQSERIDEKMNVTRHSGKASLFAAVLLALLASTTACNGGESGTSTYSSTDTYSTETPGNSYTPKKIDPEIVEPQTIDPQIVEPETVGPRPEPYRLPYEQYDPPPIPDTERCLYAGDPLCDKTVTVPPPHLDPPF